MIVARRIGVSAAMISILGIGSVLPLAGCREAPETSETAIDPSIADGASAGTTAAPASPPSPPPGIAAEPVRDPATDRDDTTAVDTENVEAALDAAQQYLDGADLPRAEAVLAVLIEKAPRDPRAQELLGRVLMRKSMDAERDGRTADALAARIEAYDAYRNATDLDPTSPGLHQSAGVIAQTAGELEAAFGHYETAATLDAVNPQYPLYAAQILIMQERYDDAATRLERVLELDPDEPLGYASFAVVEMERGNYDLALGHVAEARRIAPADVRFRVQEARVHRRRGAPELAVQLLESLDVLQRSELDPTRELAAAYTALERHTDAALAWERRYQYHRTEPDALQTVLNAGEAFVRGGQIESARRWLSQAKVLDWDAPETKRLETIFLAAESTAPPNK